MQCGFSSGESGPLVAPSFRSRSALKSTSLYSNHASHVSQLEDERGSH